jgi:general secretion pathway protein D
MKPIIFLVFLFFFRLATADTLALDFKSVKVPDLCDSVIKGILHNDYVMSPDVVKLDAVLSLSVKAIERENVLNFLRDSVSASGVVISEKSGILYLDVQKAPEPSPAVSSSVPPASYSAPVLPRSAAIYWPRNRTVEFLQLAVLAAGAVVPSSVGKDQPKMQAVIYSGTDDVLKKSADLLALLDVPIPSVHVRAALLEVTDTSESNRSISAIFNLLRGRLGLSLVSANQAANNMTLSGSTLSGVLSAIDGDNHFKYLSEPSMSVLDGEAATLTVGSDVPVRGQSSIDSRGNVLQSIDYKTAGVLLRIEPRILQNSILLKVHQQVSSFSSTVTSGIDSPTMFKRESQTVLNARPGEVIVMSGLDESKSNNSSSGVSFLPSFLQSTSASSSRSQVLLLLEVTRLD